MQLDYLYSTVRWRFYAWNERERIKNQINTQCPWSCKVEESQKSRSTRKDNRETGCWRRSVNETKFTRSNMYFCIF